MYSKGARTGGDAYLNASVRQRCPIPPKQPIQIIINKSNSGGFIHPNGNKNPEKIKIAIN